jgi:hypothetical protein
LEYDNNTKYTKLVQKPIITRVKKSTIITHTIKEWMETAFIPLSNIANVLKKKVKNLNSVYEFMVKHWRTESIIELYENCCVEFPVVKGCKIGYFSKLIPWFVRKRIKYSGLCIKHNIGLFFTNLLKNTRKKWHILEHTCITKRQCKCIENCKCYCLFCLICKHGSQPTGDFGASCHDGSCTMCQKSECPLEWSKTEVEVFLDRSYENVDGRYQAVDEEVTSSRYYMSSRIAFELQLYQEHCEHVKHWKKEWKKAKTKLQKGHILIRWDYIGKLN